MGIIASIILLATVIAKARLGSPDSYTSPELLPPTRPGGISFKLRGSEPFDLLDIVQCDKDAVNGNWGFLERSLVTPGIPWARLQIPCIPPDEYDLRLRVQRKNGAGSLNIGLVGEGHQFVAILDGWLGSDIAGLDIVNGKPFYESETTKKGRLLPIGKLSSITCAVRRDRVIVTVNDQKIIDWIANYRLASLLPAWGVPHPQSLFIGVYNGNFEIDEESLIPINGSCKLLR